MIDWRTSTCLRQTKKSRKPPSRVRYTVLETNGGNTFPWRNLLRTQKSLQQGKEGTLRALCSYSSGYHLQVRKSHSGSWSSISLEVGPSDAISIIFRKWTVSLDEPLQATVVHPASDYESISVSSLLAKHADDIFFPNVRELLKVLAILPMGST